MGATMRAALVVSLSVWASGALAAQGLGEFDRALAAYQAGDVRNAIGPFFELAEGASDPGLRAKSEFYLAQSLQKAGLLVTASTYHADVVRSGPGHPFYLESVQALVELQRSLDDPYLVPSVLAKAYREQWGALADPSRSRLYYLVALMRHRARKLDEARQLLLLVSKDSPVYAKSRYLLGVVVSDPRFPGGPRPDEALQAFQDALDQRPPAQEGLADVRQLALLGKGRVHYGLGQYELAVKEYEQVPRFSKYWDQALFELGFARFRAGDFGGALGALQALHSPQFESAFQPESWLVKATVYYFSCLYNEAATAMKAFADIYNPMAEQMTALMGRQGDDFDSYFRMLTDPNDTSLPRQVKLWVRGNQRILDLFELLGQIDKEKAQLATMGGPAAPVLEAYLDQNRQTVVQTAGKLVRARLEEASRNIHRFNQDGALIRFETTLATKRLLESGIDQNKLLADQKLYRPRIPGDDWNYWQFQGEFWIDEIGYYQYTLKQGCPSPEAEPEEAREERRPPQVPAGGAKEEP